MTDDEIIRIRDAHLTGQGDAFGMDCIGFARAIEREAIADAAKACDNEAASIEATLAFRTEFGREIATAQMMGARNCATRIRRARDASRALDQAQVQSLVDAIRAGRVEMMGTPPALNGRAHDFTVTGTTLHNAFGIDWQTVSAGFGQIYFEPNAMQMGRVLIAHEGMGREFIKAALAKMVDDAELDA